ncbi:MAG: UDP-N-acetylmuramoyl-L-alanine--D-glutamate ligase [Bacilli bacterium]
MKNVANVENKEVLVLGLAKSGTAAVRLLSKLGAKVIVNDANETMDNDLKNEFEKAGVEVVLGGHPLELLQRDLAYIVKNPGIPYRNPLLQEAVRRNITIITEVELAAWISEAPMIGITGSNGKTTTTTLTFEMFQAAQQSPLIAGNIGEVACEVVQNASSENVVVVELSSFQLMGTPTFAPEIACILNIFDAHLDYHQSKEEYIQAKATVCNNQNEQQFVVYNADDCIVNEMVQNAKSKKVPFSISTPQPEGGWIDWEQQVVMFKNTPVIALSEIVLPGKHNLMNILASVCIVKLRGVENDAIAAVLTTFAGVAHRLQYVGEVAGRRFYNDSKATNILATTVALHAFEVPTILLAGGLDRGNEFDDLIAAMSNVKAVVAFGETKQKIASAAVKAGINQIHIVHNVVEAVNTAFARSEVGDVILLSPACASWDQFKTFEQRGETFIQAVHTLEV